MTLIPPDFSSSAIQLKIAIVPYLGQILAKLMTLSCNLCFELQFLLNHLNMFPETVAQFL